jgi:hypothetical protein
MNRTCQFPEADPLDPSFQFCGQPVARPGLPYCAQHMARAYLKVRARPRLEKSSPRPAPATGSEAGLQPEGGNRRSLVGEAFWVEWITQQTT